MGWIKVEFFIKTFAVVFSCGYCFFKICGIKRSRLQIIGMCGGISAIWSLILLLLREILPVFFLILLLTLAGCGLFSLILKIRLEVAFTATLLALAVSLTIYTLSGLLAALIYAVIFGTSTVDFRLYLIILVIQITIICLLFSIRRFRDGLPFLNNRITFIAGLVISGGTLILFSQIGHSESDYFAIYLALGLILIGFGAVMGIRRGITIHYKKKLKNNAMIIFEKELAAKQAEIDSLKEENARISAANHKINQRLSSLENIAKSMAAEFSDSEDSMNQNSSENSDKYMEFMQQIGALAHEYNAEVMGAPRINVYDKVGVPEIDALLEMFALECGKKDIAFTVKLRSSVNFVINNFITKSKLATLIGDHLRNAVIAVEKSSSEFHKIALIFDVEGDKFHIRFLDSGIKFEADTLARLGTERVTTHPDSGGSGIGFMTTYETLRECGGSLTITEFDSAENNGYSKEIRISF